ncbi:hypothetical protein, partial [Paramuribaculum intestinale]|uniref:hypothetical protein n=1 Tax=Paramuribaculum intestinale TaxID=2094151 RepID=UPI0025A9F9D0
GRERKISIRSLWGCDADYLIDRPVGKKLKRAIGSLFSYYFVDLYNVLWGEVHGRGRMWCKVLFLM